MAALPVRMQKRIADKMRFFASQQDPRMFAKHIVGEKLYLFRVGDYRIVCDIGNNEI